MGDKLNLQTAGPRGPLLVQDVVFTDEMAHFDRERIPERVVHAKGAGEQRGCCAASGASLSSTLRRFVYLWLVVHSEFNPLETQTNVEPSVLLYNELSYVRFTI